MFFYIGEILEKLAFSVVKREKETTNVLYYKQYKACCWPGNEATDSMCVHLQKQMKMSDKYVC